MIKFAKYNPLRSHSRRAWNLTPHARLGTLYANLVTKNKWRLMRLAWRKKMSLTHQAKSVFYNNLLTKEYASMISTSLDSRFDTSRLSPKAYLCQHGPSAVHTSWGMLLPNPRILSGQLYSDLTSKGMISPSLC